MKLTTIKYPRTPNQVRVLTVIQGKGRVPDVFPAGPSYPAYKLPSQMGAQSSAVAAVNGDFALADGRPAHLSMIDGELWSSGIQDGSAFALTVDGSQAWVGHPSLAVNAIELGGGAEFRIARYNAGKPSGNIVAAYSKRAGTTERPPGDPSPEAADPYFCAARLDARRRDPVGGRRGRTTGAHLHGRRPARRLLAVAVDRGRRRGQRRDRDA